MPPPGHMGACCRPVVTQHALPNETAMRLNLTLEGIIGYSRLRRCLGHRTAHMRVIERFERLRGCRYGCQRFVELEETSMHRAIDEVRVEIAGECRIEGPDPQARPGHAQHTAGRGSVSPRSCPGWNRQPGDCSDRGDTENCRRR